MTPRLAIGMITAPFNFAKRDQVRDTILQSVVVQRGDMAWRFVVGLESLPLNPSRFRLEREAKRAALGLSPDPARRSPGSEDHFFRPISPKDLMERTLAAEGVVKMLLDDDDIENPDEDLRPDLVDSSDEDGENKYRKRNSGTRCI